VVGSAGFLGSPTNEGAVELGYGVHSEHRNRGYATEAARALVAWALSHDGVVQVTARSRPANVASIRVLGKAGLEQTGEANGLIRWATPSV
jgi:RimJ/RimL family protein N-acetyltransferase